MNSAFIIISFPRFAGGKFISNCLALSRHCCPQDRTSLIHLLDHPDDYNFRLQRVLTTLPAHSTQMIHWIPQFEFGDKKLYGIAHKNWLLGIKHNPDNLIQQAITQGLQLFLVSHGGDQSVRTLHSVWPNSTVIKLINHRKFSEISMRLKSDHALTLDDHAGNYCKSKYLELAGNRWPSWEIFESVGYNIRKLPDYGDVADEVTAFYNWDDIDSNSLLFDIDNSIFNGPAFLSAMQDLYKKLGYDDFDPDLVATFWQAYMSLHIDN